MAAWFGMGIDLVGHGGNIPNFLPLCPGGHVPGSLVYLLAAGFLLVGDHYSGVGYIDHLAPSQQYP